MWHPQAKGLATLHGEGKVTVFPAVGYDPPDESHFTSRHYWEVGQLDTQRAHAAGSGASSTRPANRTTRCRASRSTTAWRRRWQPKRCRWRPSARPPTTTCGRTASTNRSPGRRWKPSASWAPSEPPRPPTRRRAAPRGTRASCSRRWRRSWARKASRRTPRPSPTRRTAANSRGAWKRSRRCWRRGCRSSARR